MRLVIRLFLLATFVTLANAQFKGLIDAAKDKLKQAGQQTSPAATGPPGAKTSNGSTTAKPAGASQEKGGILPNIAVDLAVVQQQQAEVRQRCDMVARTRPDIDCDCVASAYPQLRLEAISKYTREVEKTRNLVCSSDPARCGPENALLEWISKPETQANFPTYAGRPDVRSAASLPRQMNDFLQSMPLYDAKCQNRAVLGADARSQCQEATSSGLIKLQPGKSSKAYCDCVDKAVTDGASPSEALVSCQK